MSITKQAKDYIVKFFWNGADLVPAGLLELNQYFRINGGITFDNKKEGNVIVAVSQNFRYGSIITSANSQEELDKNIKDAILTSFDIPSSYAKEVGLHKVGSEAREYALA
ncbi:MAG: hypothetical protein WCW61_03595 [Patescibacteria group bacterium]|jgi:hypothetical protein